MAGRRPCRVRLTATAETDFHSILRWTAEHFGGAQARVHGRTLSAAIESLTAWPSVVGVKRRYDVAQGLCTLHVARGGRRGRHLVLFRIGRDRDRDVIDVLRLVHEAMDLPRHVPPPAGDRDEP